MQSLTVTPVFVANKSHARNYATTGLNKTHNVENLILNALDIRFHAACGVKYKADTDILSLTEKFCNRVHVNKRLLSCKADDIFRQFPSS